MEPINEENTNAGVGVSSKRTAVNTAVTLTIVGVIGKLLGKEITLTGDGVILVTSVLGVIVGIGYRISRLITAKWPQAAWVLFGSGKEPVGVKKVGS